MTGWPGWLAGPSMAVAFLAVVGVAGWVGAWIAGRLIPPRPRATVRGTGVGVTMGFIIIAEAAAFLGVGFLSQAHTRPGQLWPWLGLVVFLTAGGLLLSVTGFRQAVRWDKSGLTQTGVLYSPRTFGWSEITAFEARGNRLALRRGDRRTDLCALDAEGIDGLLKAAEREAVAGVAEVRRRLPRDRGNRPLP